MIKLSTDVHPLVLGHVYRSKSQIQMLARKLIAHQVTEAKKVDKIVSFLCSESGSHDYTIHRREARDQLGLHIEKPNDELYRTIKALYDDIHVELQLSEKFDPNGILGINPQATYTCKRALIESFEGGSDYSLSEGRLTRMQVQLQQFPGQPLINQSALQDERLFEGWRHDLIPVIQPPSGPLNEPDHNDGQSSEPIRQPTAEHDSPIEPRKSDEKRGRNPRPRKKTRAAPDRR